MASLADTLHDAAIARAIVLARYDAGLRRKVDAILRKAEREIIAALPEATTQTRRDRLAKQLRDIQATLAGYYTQAQDLTAEQMRDLVGIEAAWQANTVNTAVGFDLLSAMPAETTLAAAAGNVLIQGAPSADWWRKQSADAQFRFANAVRQGLAQSESVQQITQRVRREMDLSRRNAMTLVRTSVQTVAIEARDMTLRANSDVLRGKTSVATLDGRTTFTCAAYDGASYSVTAPYAPIPPTTLPYLAIPRHWGCRSVWVPLVKSWRELGLDADDLPPSTRASMDGQVPETTTFEQFLAGKSEAWQNEYLGPGRAELWRSGKLTLADLIDGTGREIPLSKLR